MASKKGVGKNSRGKSGLSTRTRKVLALLVGLLSALLFFWLLDYDVNGVLKFFAIVGMLGLTGEAIRRLLFIEGEWGLMLLRTKRGLVKMDELSRWKPKLWRTFSDFGLVFGFGALSLLMFPKISKRTYVASLLILLLSVLTILPLVLPVAYSVISNLPVGSIGSRASDGGNIETVQLLFLTLLMLGGVTIAGIVGLILNAGSILYAITSFAFGGTSALASTAPGAAPIIPGKNIPLVEGILALAVILMVHESAHGILARLHKIKLKSAGIVLFGILPIGAFVDPDEAHLEKAPKLHQRDVLVAGSTANFITTFLAFALLFLFIVATAPVQDNSVMMTAYVNSTPLFGPMMLASVNGMQISKPDDLTILSSIDAEDVVELKTSEGKQITATLNDEARIISIASDNEKYVLEPDEPTLLSISFTNQNNQPFIFLGTRMGTITYSNAFKPGWGWLGAIYAFLGLAFVLNFLIGSINLMPIPMFDGHRLVGLAVPNQFAMKMITYAVAFAFIVNLLPWLWV
ncbi:hypothetical protein DRN67_00315 [Candidatus Micrarchaeota archaeon]|nr:MAG: hypothetical protein DRN67_00315 [Candidatus Micrarchaeota archaeon]